MRLGGLRRSSNVQIRRGGGKAVGGGLGMFGIALVVYLLGGNQMPFIAEGVSRTIESSTTKPSRLTEEQQAEQADFVSAVLGSTEDIWGQIYAQNNETYPQPGMVLFAGATDTACGTGRSAMGPFYCPLDQKVYLDLDFFYELEHKLDAGGDFARAYVIAHEVGHHVQNVQGRLEGRRSNADSVKIELMADCYAGIWAHHIADFGALEDGDVEEAMNAAAQIGDDKLQENAGRVARPDSFTHGSSAQRMAAFKTGFDSGDPASCN